MHFECGGQNVVFVGTLVRVTSDSIWLRPNGAATFSVAQQAIKTARASRGVSRWRSAIIFGRTHLPHSHDDA